MPHLGAHILNEIIVAPRAIVVRRDAVEGFLGVAQLRLRERVRGGVGDPAHNVCRYRLGARKAT